MLHWPGGSRGELKTAGLSNRARKDSGRRHHAVCLCAVTNSGKAAGSMLAIASLRECFVWSYGEIGSKVAPRACCRVMVDLSAGGCACPVT